jgi:hypothetical protein
MTMEDLDIRLKLQDKANQIVNEAILKSGQDIDPVIKDFVNAVTVLAMKQGYIWGVSTVKQTTEYLINNVKGHTS